MIYIPFVIILNGCNETDKKGKVVYYEFMLVNKSTKPVTLNLFRKDTVLYNSIFIDSNLTQLIDKGNEDPGMAQEFFLTNLLDSAQFIFSDGKMLTQTYFKKGNNDTINNVLFIIHYNTIELTDEKKKLLFTLTEADYLRAR